jgi:cytochrome bd-type quinol oxidase subunit 2
MVQWSYRAEDHGGLTGLMLAAQFLLSVEIFATATMFGSLALFLALTSTTGELNQRIRRVALLIAWAYGLALLLVTPYLYFMFASGVPRGQLWDTVQFSADLLNFLIPTSVNALGAAKSSGEVAATFPGNQFERAAYLGPILIGLAAVYGWRHWKEPLGKVLIDSLVVICVLSFGPVLHLGGRELVGMPGKGLAVMPGIDKALPCVS